MKLGITKEELPLFVDRLRRYAGGMFVGIGLGMFFAVGFVPEDDRKIFHAHYFVIAWACICVGGLVANLGWHKKSSNESHVA